jgi:hypothetical protein
MTKKVYQLDEEFIKQLDNVVGSLSAIAHLLRKEFFYHNTLREAALTLRLACDNFCQHGEFLLEGELDSDIGKEG